MYNIIKYLLFVLLAALLPLSIYAKKTDLHLQNTTLPEALQELDISCVNEVRCRVGYVELNSDTFPSTKVNGQEDLRKRIHNEFYWKLGGEDSMYFYKLRWVVWKNKRFDNNRNYLMQM